MVKKMLMVAASAALATSLAVPATAQWHDNQDRGGYGQYRQAEDVGYRDGLNDGRHDRDTGHSFRPTHDDNYKNADRGYSSNMGSKQAYKDTYRRGYERGYNEGYNRGGGYRR